MSNAIDCITQCRLIIIWALRSGEYNQIQGRLSAGDGKGYCVVGLINVIAKLYGVNFQEVLCEERKDRFATALVKRIAKLSSVKCQRVTSEERRDYFAATLVKRNDLGRATFAQFADEFEDRWQLKTKNFKGRKDSMVKEFLELWVSKKVVESEKLEKVKIDEHAKYQTLESWMLKTLQELPDPPAPLDGGMALAA